MRHFQLVGSVDALPLVHAIQRQPDLWNANTLRTTYPGSPHAAADDIWLFFNATDDAAAVVDDKDAIPYPAWERLPQARALVFDLMRRVEGVRLGRVLITRLAPGKRITPHADMGAPAEYYDRYQIALQSLPGCVFRIEDESVTFRAGEVWWIDNCREHSVTNNSADDRIVMIVDIRAG